MGCASSSTDGGNTNAHLLLKFKHVRLGDIEVSSLPQLVIGRIGDINSALESPYAYKSCALYRIDLQQRNEQGSWEDSFTETQSAPFILMDPDSGEKHLQVDVKNASLLPRVGDEFLREYVALSPRENSASIRSFLERAGADSKKLERYRVREVTFEYNAQLAVFGVVEKDSASGFKITPATSESVSVDFKRKHKWTSSDEKVWDQLVSSSSARVLFADDPLYFKGQLVKSLKGMKTAGQSEEPKTAPGGLSAVAVTDDSAKYIRSPVASSQIFVQLPPGASPGTKVRVPGPDGNSLLIDVPMDYSAGQVVELKR